ncbi:LysR family transcriptional regulator [Rhodococcus sp. BP-316]|uniref:LysR family transcriptional regulator n=1 Tax=Rhodococcus sp. BP-316 TaxID=2739445 RepID=UPI001C9B61C8|nr:LysR family transcriptional regulator [Rhodococcus sp. BP-316]MBY6681512.1 LysR family transcriptional regulator [Rhodococcus sp. BP-316]
MDSRLLDTFLAVVETGTFAAAAAHMHTVQSTVSASIKALEHDLRVQLFDRSARTARLTPAGQALVPRARAILDELELTRTSLQDIASGLNGVLRVGAIGSTEPIGLPAALKRFGDANPHVTLHVLSDAVGTAGLVERLLRSEVDVAFLAGRFPGAVPADAHRKIILEILAEGPLVIIAAPDHPLAGRSGLDLSDVASETWIESPTGQTNRMVTDEVFTARGLHRVVNLEVAEPTQVPNYVAAGIGIAVVPDFIAAHRRDVQILDIVGPPLRWSIAIARHHSRTSLLLEAFWDEFVPQPTAAN